MKLSSLTLAAALLVTSAPVAWALPPVDEATATKLAGEIDTALGSMIPPTAVGTLKLEGKTEVKPAGSAFTFTLPTVVVDTTAATFRSGAITGTLTPMDDTQYAFVLTLPAGLGTFSDIAGTPVMTAALDSQDIKGVWTPGSDLLPELTANLANVVFNQPQSKVSFGIRAVALAMHSAVDGAGKMSSTFVTTIRNVSVMGPNSNVTVGEIGLRSATAGVDYAAVKAVREEMKAALATATTPAGGGKKLPEILEALSSTGGQYTFAGDLSDFVMNYNTSLIDQAGSWGITKAHFNSEGATPEAGAATISFSLGHEGLTMHPVPSPAVGAVLPTASNLQVDISRIPVAALLKLATDPVGMQAGGEAFEAFRKAMGQAKTELRITNLETKAPSLGAVLSGAFTGDAQARFGIAGSLEGKLTGVDELVTKISQMTQAAAQPTPGTAAPVPQPDPAAQGLLMALSVVQTQGTPVPNVSPSVRRYVFALGPDGSFKLNGVDLGMMLGINAQGAPSSATTPHDMPPPEVNLPPVAAPAAPAASKP